MLIAEVNGERCHATKGAKGICPHCKSEVYARCGERKIAHWAHKSIQECNSLHEKETEWHLMWKNYFPLEWQEITQYDQQGERHVADVRTPTGFTLEFQHSNIDPTERRSREKFYKNMNWIVDGTCLKRDYKRFENGIKSARLFRKIILPTQNQMHVGNILEISYAEEIFPENWINSVVPVLFDFKGLQEINAPDDLRQCIFCLLPIKKHSYVIQMPISIFIENARSGGWEVFIHNQMNEILNNMGSNLVRQQVQHRSSYPMGPRIDRLPYSQMGYYQKKRKQF